MSRTDNHRIEARLLRASAMCELACACVLPAHAQQVGIDLASGDVRLRGQGGSGALFVAPSLSTDAPFGNFAARGMLLLVNGRAVRTHLDAGLTGRSWRFGLAPIIRIRAADDQVNLTGRSQRLDGEFGAVLGSPSFGAFLAGGIAQSVHGRTQRSVETSRAGVHLAARGVRVAVAYEGSAFDAPNAEQAAMTVGAAPRLRLADVTSDISWQWQRLTLGAFAGRRLSGHGGMLHQAPWGGGHVEIALSERTSFIARHASAPSDPSRHLPGQRMSTIGFRLTPTARHARFEDGSTTRTPAREFTVVARARGMQVLRVHAPDARTVEISGSFSEWHPVMMQRVRSGWWELSQVIPAGLHHFNVRMDNGRWTVPLGAEVANDEFQGSVGVLLIAPDTSADATMDR